MASQASYRPRWNKDIVPLVKELKQLSKTEQINLLEAALKTDKTEERHSKSWKEKDGEKVFEYEGNANIQNVDDAVKFSGMDMDIWEHTKPEFRTWTTTTKTGIKWNVYVKLKFQRIEEQEKAFAKLKTELLKDLEQFDSPSIIYRNRKKETGQAAVINIYDAHLDKLCLPDETNSDYNLDIAVSRFEEAIDSLLTDCKNHKLEEVIFPIGNDFFHVNSDANTTKRGTPQDTGTRLFDTFRHGSKLIRRCIEKCLYVAPKVVCPIVYGNHDPDVTFYLGELLKAVYEGNENIIIDNNPKQRKYHLFGKNLLGFAHGNIAKSKVNKVPQWMAQEQPELWAKSKYRTFYFGDIHHRQNYNLQVSVDLIGVEVKFLRSIAGTDAWHHRSGYVGVPKTASAYIWHKEDGEVASYKTNF